jgi:hypothetical protein
MVPALLPQPRTAAEGCNASSGGEQLQQPTGAIHQPVTLTGGFGPAHGDAIGVGLVLLALKVMPMAVLVLPFDVDRHGWRPEQHETDESGNETADLWRQGRQHLDVCWVDLLRASPV